jgi:hypothetical protein
MIENPNQTETSGPENALDDPAKRSRTRNRGRRPELGVASKPASALVSLVARHPTGSFLVMAFTFLWLSMVPVLFMGWPPPPPTTPLGHLVAAALGACSLALPAFVVTAGVGGKAGVRDLVSRTLRWRVRVRWYLFAVFGVPLGALLLAPLFLGAEPIEALGQNWTLLFTSFLPKTDPGPGDNSAVRGGRLDGVYAAPGASSAWGAQGGPIDWAGIRTNPSTDLPLWP